MRITKRAAVGIVALSTAAMSAAVLTGAAGAGASTPHKVPVVTVHMSNKHVRLSTGTRVHAGKVIYRVVTRKGDQQLQILRLHKGYTMQQAATDIGKAFGGDVNAIERIDTRITWRGGAEARPDHPGRFATTLAAGHFLFLNFSAHSQAVTPVTVYGKVPNRAAIPHQSAMTAYSYGWGVSSNTIPATGWTHFFNQSDQPHLLAFQHVKQGTTAKMVRRYIKSGSNARPPFALRGGTESGVISPYFAETFHYSLHTGKYLMICWWPDDETGTAHVDDGMWKLMQLK